MRRAPSGTMPAEVRKFCRTASGQREPRHHAGDARIAHGGRRRRRAAGSRGRPPDGRGPPRGRRARRRPSPGRGPTPARPRRTRPPCCRRWRRGRAWRGDGGAAMRVRPRLAEDLRVEGADDGPEGPAPRHGPARPRWRRRRRPRAGRTAASARGRAQQVPGPGVRHRVSLAPSCRSPPWCRCPPWCRLPTVVPVPHRREKAAVCQCLSVGSAAWLPPTRRSPTRSFRHRPRGRGAVEGHLPLGRHGGAGPRQRPDADVLFAARVSTQGEQTPGRARRRRRSAPRA